MRWKSKVFRPDHIQSSLKFRYGCFDFYHFEIALKRNKNDYSLESYFLIKWGSITEGKILKA